MTCVIGVRHEGRVVLGGDGRDTAKLFMYPSEPKVWQVGDFVLGHSGDGRACQVSKHAFKPTSPGPKADLMQHMVCTFVPQLRDALKSAGVELDGRDAATITMIVGVRGRLFELDEEMSVYEYPEFTAIGCGAAFALGSLRETKKLAPRTRVQRALTAASAYSAGVGPPFTFVSTAPPGAP